MSAKKGVLGMFPEHTRRKQYEKDNPKKGLGCLPLATTVQSLQAEDNAPTAMGRIYVNFGNTIGRCQSVKKTSEDDSSELQVRRANPASFR